MGLMYGVLRGTCQRLVESAGVGSTDPMISIHDRPPDELTLPDEAGAIAGEPFDALFRPDRFEKGDVAVVCHDARVILGYTWICLNDLWLSESRLFLRIREDEAVLYDIFVFPRYRGVRSRPGSPQLAGKGDGEPEFRSVGLRLSLAALAEAGRRGRKRVFTCSDCHNDKSFRLQRRWGGTHVMTIYSVHLLNRFSLHWATGRPFASMFYKPEGRLGSA
jgi:hypothetical protein